MRALHSLTSLTRHRGDIVKVARIKGWLSGEFREGAWRKTQEIFIRTIVAVLKQAQIGLPCTSLINPTNVMVWRQTVQLRIAMGRLSKEKKRRRGAPSYSNVFFAFRGAVNRQKFS